MAKYNRLMRFCQQILLAVCYLIPCLISTAYAEERIHNYDVSAVLEKDGSLLVTENITVNVEHEQIKHGITRTYPVRQGIDENYVLKTTFDVQQVTVDGKPEDYLLTRGYFMDGMAIGKEKELVSKGKHTYTIVYRTQGHVRFLEDHDEIYLNAIGLDNQFPVDKASFKLSLPDGEQPLMTKAFTGKSGEQGQDYKMTAPMTFNTTKELPEKSGMTVVVGWRKGLVTPPEKTFSDWLNEHRTLALLGLMAAVCIYLAGAWYFVYRKPKKPVSPIFTPPENLTPGMVAWMKEKALTPVMLQADLMWLAVNGFAKMDLSEKECVKFFEEPAENAEDNWITTACKAICKHFYAVDHVVLLGRDGRHPSRSLTTAWAALRKWYKTATRPLTERSFLPGIIGLAGGVYAFYKLLDVIYHPGYTNNMSSIDTLMLPGTYLALAVYLTYSAIKGRQGTAYHGIWARIIVPLFKWGLIVFLFLSGAFLLDFDWLIISVFFGVGLVPALFMVKFATPLTEEGRQIADQIEGLRMYILMAEKERLALLNAPDDTVEKYEELLPYAIAMGCADAWQKRFDPMLETIDYRPSWSTIPDGMSSIAYRDLAKESMIDGSPSVTAIRTAIAESESSKSSSSFFGGSGKSGGGSGGGGVGGW